MEEQFENIGSTLKGILDSNPMMLNKSSQQDSSMNEVEKDWASYCKNYAMRVAKLENEDDRDEIRMEMEQMYYKKKKKQWPIILNCIIGKGLWSIRLLVILGFTSL